LLVLHTGSNIYGH